MKKISKLKLNNLSASALEAREMNHLTGGDNYCECSCAPGVDVASPLAYSSDSPPNGQCACGCGCNPTIYTNLTELSAAAGDIGGGFYD